MSILEKFKHLFISKEEIMIRDAKLAAELEQALSVDYIEKLNKSSITDRYKKLVTDTLDSDQLQTIVEGDLVGDLTAIKGIGKKTAEKILKELK